MNSPSAEPELVALTLLAEEAAQQQGQRPNGAHLMAAIVSTRNPAAELLRERGLNKQQLLVVSKDREEAGADALRAIMRRAKSIASRMGGAPNALHVLIALVSDRKGSAHLALSACGVDINRLRAQAMNLGLGLVGPRRHQGAKPTPKQAALKSKRPGKGVAVPLVETGKRKASVKKPKEAAQLVADPILRAPAPKASPTLVATPSLVRFELCPKRHPILTKIGDNLSLARVAR